MTNGPIKRSPSKKLLEAASKKNTNALTVMKQKRKASGIAKKAAREEAIKGAWVLRPVREKNLANSKKLFAASRALKKSARSPR